MLELKNNKQNTYYRYTYLKRDLAPPKKHNNNITTLMSCNIRACKGSARSSCSIFLRSELIWQYWRTCCFGKGNTYKLFANHNALGQLTNHNTFCFLEGGPSSNPELIESFVSGWGERYCNNVNYVKNNAIFAPPNMSACSSTPLKQNQNFVLLYYK